jgi:hypothetical protein
MSLTLKRNLPLILLLVGILVLTIAGGNYPIIAYYL